MNVSVLSSNLAVLLSITLYSTGHWIGGTAALICSLLGVIK